MPPKSRTKASKSQLTLPNTNDQTLYEGDHLASFLSSFQKEIESAKLCNKVLPEKLWYKRQFAIGVNEVTRILERMNPSHGTSFGTTLQAVLVASDCNPRWLTKHLPSLASSRNVPLIYVRDKKLGSLRLGELVKIKTAIAVGVKVRESSINQFVQRVLLDGKSNGTGCTDSAAVVESGW